MIEGLLEFEGYRLRDGEVVPESEKARVFEIVRGGNTYRVEVSEVDAYGVLGHAAPDVRGVLNCVRGLGELLRKENF